MAAIEYSRELEHQRQYSDERRLNAQVARMVNELLLLVGPSREYISLRCECGVIGCAAPVVLPRTRLDDIREEAGVFVVAPGHYVNVEGDLLSSDLTYALISFRETEPILATEAELARLVFDSLPRSH